MQDKEKNKSIETQITELLNSRDNVKVISENETSYTVTLTQGGPISDGCSLVYCDSLDEAKDGIIKVCSRFMENISENGRFNLYIIENLKLSLSSDYNPCGEFGKGYCLSIKIKLVLSD